MAINLILPELDKPKSTKDQIINIVARRYPLKAKEIYSSIKKEYASSVSYQAIHKLLRELVDDRVFVKEELSYSINLEWLKRVSDFLSFVEQNYNNQKSLVSGPSRVEKIGEIKIMEFDSLADLDIFFMDHEEKFHRKKKKGIVVWLAKHYHWPFAYSKKMFDVQEIKEEKKNSYKIFGSSTPLDRWSMKFYKQLGVNVIFEKNAAQKEDIAVYGDEILEIKYGEELVSTICDFFKKNKDFERIDMAGFFKEILNRKTKITVTVQKNEYIADGIVRESIRLFGNKK